MKRNDNVTLLLRVMDDAFSKRGWHGPNVRGAVRGVDVEAATWRVADGRHNIRELVLHIAYWKYIARRRLTGARIAFPLPGSDWFRRDELDARAWREEIELMEAEHRALRNEVAALHDDDLARTIGKGDVARMLYGCAAHDTYHCGQIGLLRGAYRER